MQANEFITGQSTTGKRRLIFRTEKTVLDSLVPGASSAPLDAYGESILASVLESACASTVLDSSMALAGAASWQCEDPVKVSCTVSAAAHHKICMKARSLHVPEHMMASALLKLASASGNRGCQSVLAKMMTNSARTPRPEQEMFFGYLNESTNKGGIGLCESATGTGKTAAVIAAAAVLLEKHPHDNVLIAAPTLLLVQDFEREARSMGIEVRVVVGRNEFVSPVELSSFLVDEACKLDPAHVAAISRWIQGGGKPRVHGIQRNWLAASVLAIDPNFPIGEARISDAPKDDDGGYAEYRSQFAVEDCDPSERAGEIIICSHAMLAIDLRRRLWAANKDDEVKVARKWMDAAIKRAVAEKGENNMASEKTLSRIKSEKAVVMKLSSQVSAECGILPDYQWVFIDEAHLFESSVSSSLSDYLSVNKLIKLAEEKGAKRVAPTIRKLATELRKFADASGGEDIALHVAGAATRRIIQIIKEMRAALAGGKVRAENGFGRESSILDMATRQINGNVAYLTFSPSRHYPQLRVGRQNVGNYLEFLWTLVKGGACVSATLYLPKENDVKSGSYIASILNIPKSRIMEYPPICPSWVKNTVTGVFLPPVRTVIGDRIRLSPPSSALTKAAATRDNDLWITELSDEIFKIYNTSAGGVLVLVTSYKTATDLASTLIGFLGADLITPCTDESLPSQRRRMLTISARGKKPLWIAVGGAWTGLNVGGHDPWLEVAEKIIPASEDNVVTDLVIPRIPYRTNKSLTHTHRVERSPHVPWDRLDVLFKLRQAIGRLVRREGLPKNRRIFLLDGRIHDKKSGGIVAGIKPILAGYELKIVKLAINSNKQQPGRNAGPFLEGANCVVQFISNVASFGRS